MVLNLYYDLGFDFEPVFNELEEPRQNKFLQMKAKFEQLYAENAVGLHKNREHEYPTDFTLLRFLQGEKYKVNSAAKRLMNTMKWRQEMRVAHLLAYAPSYMDIYLRAWVRLHTGFCKKGRPVICDRLSEFMNFSNYHALPFEQFVICHIRYMELTCEALHEASARKGKPIQFVTFVGNLGGLKLAKAFSAAPMMKRLGKKIDETHYPEMAGTLYLINCPSFVSSMWSIAKRFLDPTTESKFRIYTDTPIQVLEEEIGLDALPPDFGGTSKAHFPTTMRHEDIKRITMPWN